MEPNPDPVALAQRLHRYMSSPDYEGGDGPATALGKIEATIRSEYAGTERPMDRMEAIVEDLTAAVRELTTAILAGGAAEPTRQTGVRAGDPEMDEPFGTPV